MRQMKIGVMPFRTAAYAAMRCNHPKELDTLQLRGQVRRSWDLLHSKEGEPWEGSRLMRRDQLGGDELQAREAVLADRLRE